MEAYLFVSFEAVSSRYIYTSPPAAPYQLPIPALYRKRVLGAMSAYILRPDH